MASPLLSPVALHSPLHPLSPERINGLQRSLFAVTSPTTASPKPSKLNTTSNGTTEGMLSSGRKANLFADYQPKSSDTQSNTFGPPGSPSLAEFSSLRSHTRTNSDVQGLVKRFEHLDVRDRDAENVERRKKYEAELKRSQMAREEAESDVKRLRAELRTMKKEADDGRERERLVAKRLEVVMEEFANSKQTHATAAGVYEKEIRKARKEAFKTSSAVLKLQEELKSTRSSLRITQSGFDLEKQKVQRKEQDTFEAQYKLVAVQEELEKVQASLQLLREENEGLKTSLKDEEVARMAAEGMIALPLAQDNDDDLLASPQRSPRRRPASPLSDDKENQQLSPRKSAEARRLQAELAQEKARREYAEEMVEFARLECLYRCCSCRVASKEHHDEPVSSHSDAVDEATQLQAEAKSVLILKSTPEDVEMDEVADDTRPRDDHHAEFSAMNVQESHEPLDPIVNSANTFSTTTNEMEMEVSPRDEERREEPSLAATVTSRTSSRHSALTNTRSRVSNESIVSRHDRRHRERSHTPPVPLQTSHHQEVKVPLRSPTPELPPSNKTSTPFRPQPSIKTITTTTTIPMQFTPIAKPVPKSSTSWSEDDRENVAPVAEDAIQLPPIDREAALAAIQYRRGRARSIANGQITPRKQMLEGVSINERRDISAPVQGSKIVATGVAKSASVSRATTKRVV